MKIIGFAVLAAGLLAGTTGAVAAERESVTLKISTAGVDFANPKSVAAFRRNIERQIAAACNPGDRIDADYAPDFQCCAEIATTVELIVTRMAMRAIERRMATTD